MIANFDISFISELFFYFLICIYSVFFDQSANSCDVQLFCDMFHCYIIFLVADIKNQLFLEYQIFLEYMTYCYCVYQYKLLN